MLAREKAQALLKKHENFLKSLIQLNDQRVAAEGLNPEDSPLFADLLRELQALATQNSEVKEGKAEELTLLFDKLNRTYPECGFSFSSFTHDPAISASLWSFQIDFEDFCSPVTPAKARKILSAGFYSECIKYLSDNPQDNNLSKVVRSVIRALQAIEKKAPEFKPELTAWNGKPLPATPAAYIRAVVLGPAQQEFYSWRRLWPSNRSSVPEKTWEVAGVDIFENDVRACFQIETPDEQVFREQFEKEIEEAYNKLRALTRRYLSSIAEDAADTPRKNKKSFLSGLLVKLEHSPVLDGYFPYHDHYPSQSAWAWRLQFNRLHEFRRHLTDPELAVHEDSDWHSYLLKALSIVASVDPAQYPHVPSRVAGSAVDSSPPPASIPEPQAPATTAAVIPQPAALTSAVFAEKHALSLNFSGIFRAIKKFFSKMRDLLLNKKLQLTMDGINAHATANPGSRTAHILQVMGSPMTAKEFKLDYEKRRSQKFFNNPFETTMRTALKASEDIDMTMVKDHAIKRPDSLTAEILKSYSKGP